MGILLTKSTKIITTPSTCLTRLHTYLNKQAKLRRLDSGNSTYSSSREPKSRIFKTELPYTSTKITVRDNKSKISKLSTKSPIANNITKSIRSHTALNKTHKSSNSFSDQSDDRFRQIKERYANRLQNVPTKTNSISYIVSHNNSMTQYYHKSINDILNYKPTRPSNTDNESRMISLLPLQDFLK